MLFFFLLASAFPLYEEAGRFPPWKVGYVTAFTPPVIDEWDPVIPPCIVLF
jgi:hypothetical protein